MKLGDIRENYLGLLSLAKNVYPAVITSAIVDNLSVLEKENDLLEQKRKQICENYAKKDEDGKPVVDNRRYDIPEECKEAFDQEIKDLMNIDKEIAIKKVSSKDFEKCESSERYTIPSVSDRIAMKFMTE